MSTTRGGLRRDSLHWTPVRRIAAPATVVNAARNAKLFISYASVDRQLIAALVEFLRGQGWEVWWDRHLEAGEAFDRRIEQELSAADCVIVAWSRAAVQSNWVLSEAMVGFESNRLVPVALDARLTIPLPFNRVHTVLLCDWAGALDHPGLQDVAQGVRATLESRGLRGGQARDAGRKPVVAVLPFDDLDAAAAPRALCAVVPTRLIAALDRFSGLETLSRRASFDPALQSQEIRAAARALRADYVVTGSVCGAGGSLMLSAELIEGDTGRQSWSATLMADETGALSADRAAEEFARALSGEFLQLARARARDGAERGDTQSLVEASHETLLQSSQAAIAAAARDARRAIAATPADGHAHALLASAIAEEIVNGYAPDLDAACAEARRAAERALLLSPDNHAVLKYAGHALAICGDHEHGERVLRHALELNRFDDGARGYLGWVLAPSTAPAHLAEIDTTLDQLLASAQRHPGRPFWFLHRAVAYTCRGDFEAALAAARIAASFGPNLTLAWLHAVNALGQLGRVEEARALVERCPLDLARPGVAWDALLRLVSRDARAAELRTAGLRKAGLTSGPSPSGTVAAADPLLRQFLDLWRGAGSADESAARRVAAVVFDHYREAARRYHTLDHIAHCLRQADLAAAALPQADALRLAIWFHDVVYLPSAPDNEARSAELFRDLALPALPGPLVDDVTRLILVTRYGETARRADEAWMVDIDYSSFGLPWEEFLRDSRAVREERIDLDPAGYAAQHSQFLASLLARERLYRTDFFHDRYEAAARDNIARYLGMIGGSATK
jgi:predicted metal-dependent HD superfamily phosphohydrolase/TolB-like protein